MTPWKPVAAFTLSAACLGLLIALAYREPAWWLLVLAVWFGAGYVAAGWVYAFFRQEWLVPGELPSYWRGDLITLALFAWACGPAALIATVGSKYTAHGRLYWWEDKGE